MSEEQQATRINAEFAPILIEPLFDEKSRYVILWGGRSGMKSWGIGRALIIRAVRNRLRIVIVRETKSSTEDSVHTLLAQQISLMGLDAAFKIEKQTITCVNGSVIFFAGIRNDPKSLKSMESIDLCWCEEAQNISKEAWDILIPTIRKPGSQIIVSFNPDMESDETYQRFIVRRPPRCRVVKVNYTDNPYLSPEMIEEAHYMRDTDPDGYLNVWLGHPKQHLENAIYGRELRKAREENRITKVGYDPLVKVDTFWDLGWRDSTSILLAQVIQNEYRVIDFMQGSQQTVNDYLRELQAKPYIYGTDFLPHDAKAKSLGTGKSIEEIMRSNGRRVSIVPRLSMEDGINAVRTIFPKLWFDEGNCAALLEALSKYQYDQSEAKPKPLHDQWSHAADSLKYMAISLRGPTAEPDTFRRPAHHYAGATGWMI